MHFINSEESQMKALNRAIARTVSQIARHAGEGCHVPMIMALENHLDALLTMERKRLELAGGPEWTRTAVASFNSLDAEQVREIHHSAGANDNVQEPPSLSPFQWMAGDKVVFVGSGEPGFTKGKAYVIDGIDALAGSLRIIDDIGNVREIFSHNWIAANLRNYSKRGEQAQPAPDVIDMTDPRNWQVWDVVVRIAPTFGPMFDMGDEYVVSKIDADGELVYISTNYERPYEYPFGLLRSDPPFQWLRHGEVQS